MKATLSRDDRAAHMIAEQLTAPSALALRSSAREGRKPSAIIFPPLRETKSIRFSRIPPVWLCSSCTCRSGTRWTAAAHQQQERHKGSDCVKGPESEILQDKRLGEPSQHNRTPRFPLSQLVKVCPAGLSWRQTEKFTVA